MYIRTYLGDLRRHFSNSNALTGSDTTSYICGHSKKTAWKTFQEHFGLLQDLGVGELESGTIKAAECFMCKIYRIDTNSLDKARFILFPKLDTPDKLPPTSDAFIFHLKRVHFQAMVWRQANVAMQILPKPEDMGWRNEDGILEPILMSLDPIPKACLELIRCQCTTGCRTLRCKCRKANLFCTALCMCDEANQQVACINKTPN